MGWIIVLLLLYEFFRYIIIDVNFETDYNINSIMENNEIPKGKKAFAQGYISFTSQQIKEEIKEGNINAVAYSWIDEALNVASNVEDGDKGGVVDVYPKTIEQTNKMHEYLDKARLAVVDKEDLTFANRYSELKKIVKWSGERHWNIEWYLVLFTFISFLFTAGDALTKRAALNDYKAVLHNVRNWEKGDESLVKKNMSYLDIDFEFSTPKTFRLTNESKYQKISNSNLEFYNNAIKKSKSANISEDDRKFI